MSKAAFFCIPAHGHINPTLALAEALVKEGEEVVYYTSGEFAGKISLTGARAEIIRTKYDALVKELGHTEGKNILAVAAFIYEAGLEVIEKVFESVKRENPDYIITDSVTIYGKAIAMMLGKPYLCTVPVFGFADLNLPKCPWPFFTARMVLQALTSLGKMKKCFDLAGIYRDKLKVNWPGLIHPLNDYAQLNISTTTKTFQFDSDKLEKKGFKFVGPMLFDKRENPDFPVEKIMGKKAVYISLGTVYNRDEKFFKDCFAAFENSPYTAVMSAGGMKFSPQENTLEGVKIPGNFIARQYIPQLKVLPHIGAFISHCGMNSAHESMYFGVPLVAVPQAADQFMIGMRARDLGAAIYLPKPNARSLRKAVDRIFSDRKFAQNAAKLGKEMRDAGGAKKAVEEIFKFKAAKGIN